MIDALRNKYKLNELLPVLHLSKSSYCYQVQCIKREDKYKVLRDKIKELFATNKERYGYRRIHCLLRKDGIIVSEKIVRRIMNDEHLFVKTTKKRKYNSYKGEISPEVENVINRDFSALQPNQKWLTDITEFHIPAGKVYLSPIIDCFDGMAVSWTIGTSPNAELVNTMLQEAISTLNTSEHPMVHSDRGCHYRWPTGLELWILLSLLVLCRRKDAHQTILPVRVSLVDLKMKCFTIEAGIVLLLILSSMNWMNICIGIMKNESKCH